MANPTTFEQIKGLSITAFELKQLTDWKDPVIDEFLNTLRSLSTISEIIDTLIDRLEDGTEQGQLVFWDATLERWVHTESTEFIWDDTGKSVGIESAIGRQLRLLYNAANYTDFLVDLSGQLHIATIGNKIFIDDYTSNGFVKTINGTGEVQIDTTLYLPVSDYKTYDLDAMLNLDYPESHRVITYGAHGITDIDVYDTDALILQIFDRVISYNGTGQITTIATTDLINDVVLTKTLTYNIGGELIDVHRIEEPV